jgi:HSP20 family protein
MEEKMNLIRYNPERWLDGMLARAMHELFGPWPTIPYGEDVAWAPRMDIREQGNAIVLEAEIPGADRDALKLEVKDGVLSLKGEKRREHSEENGGVYRSERAYGAFTRRFLLPEEVDGDKIEAAYKDGVLTIILPKKPELAPKRIAVKTDVTSEAKQISAN